MSPEECTGCGICVNSCPVDVIRMNEKKNKAKLKYPEDCMMCGWCAMDCPEGIIKLTPERQIDPEKTMPAQVLSWG